MAQKYDWETLNTRLIKALKPAQNAVVIKFIKTQGELDSIPNIHYFRQKGVACQAVGIAGHYNFPVAIQSETFIMNYCAGANGCAKRDAKWLSGKTLSTDPLKWFENIEASAAHSKAMLEGCPSDEHIAMVAASMALAAIESPDVICMQLTPGAAFLLLSGLVQKDYQKINFPFVGESSCTDTWGYTYNTGNPGLSLGCRGDRCFGALASDEVRITLKPHDLVKTLDGMDRLAKSGIAYPFYPDGVYPSCLL